MFVLPHSCVKVLTTKMKVLGDETFVMQLHYEDGALTNGITAFIKGIPKCSLATLLPYENIMIRYNL
jgi:hypothetical protein